MRDNHIPVKDAIACLEVMREHILDRIGNLGMEVYEELCDVMALNIAIKALKKEDGLITAISNLHRAESSDGQEYVQLYDVLETIRRYENKGSSA